MADGVSDGHDAAAPSRGRVDGEPVNIRLGRPGWSGSDLQSVGHPADDDVHHAPRHGHGVVGEALV
jgi:hypothetical protein